MKKLTIALSFLVFAIPFQSCNPEEVLNGLNQGLSNEDVVKGLKSALTVGTDSSVKRLSATDGYFKDLAVKILLPPEAAPIFNKVGSIPGGQELIDKTIEAINRSAEDAAPEATGIFVDAITNISIADGMNILKGHDSAATGYLKDNTYDSLKGVFAPKINTSLSKPIVFNASAASLYTDLVDLYNDASLNGILWPKITQNTLGDYVTSKALTGLFHKVAVEEGKIRNDVSHRVNDILKKVFGQ